MTARFQFWLYQFTWTLALFLAVLILPIVFLFRRDLAVWFWQRLWPRPLEPHTLWLHGVSVGELKLAISLLQAQDNLDWSQVLITTVTPNGWNYLQQLEQPCQKRRLPFDWLPSLNRFITAQSTHLLLVETEIWPALFQLVHKYGGTTAIINGRYGKKNQRNPFQALIRQTLFNLDRVFARNASDLQAFIAAGLPARNGQAAGNLKFDLKPNAQIPPNLRVWCENQPFIVFASVAEDERTGFAPIIQDLLQKDPSLRILYAPRQVQQANAHRDLFDDGITRLRSQNAFDQSRLLILDSLGELAGTFRYATACVMGGGFGNRGGQNFLEPLAAGCPTLIGPYMTNFAEETQAAMEAAAILKVVSFEDLAEKMTGLLQSPEILADLRQRGLEFMSTHSGSLVRTRDRLLDWGWLPLQQPDPKPLE